MKQTQVAEQVAEGARAREEEARASGRELAERARKAEALVAEYEADIGQVSCVFVSLNLSYAQAHIAQSTIKDARVCVAHIPCKPDRIGGRTSFICAREYQAKLNSLSRPHSQLRAAQEGSSALVFCILLSCISIS